MTPKNKAAKLRYLISIELGLQTEHEKVIKCALIAIDEILNHDNNFIQTSLHCSYWEEVKEILENKL
jgi:hypothetical protein